MSTSKMLLAALKGMCVFRLKSFPGVSAGDGDVAKLLKGNGAHIAMAWHCFHHLEQRNGFCFCGRRLSFCPYTFPHLCL